MAELPLTTKQPYKTARPHYRSYAGYLPRHRGILSPQWYIITSLLDQWFLLLLELFDILYHKRLVLKRLTHAAVYL